MFKVDNKDTRMTTISIHPERGYKNWHRSSVFIVNLEHISLLALVFLLLTLNM